MKIELEMESGKKHVIEYKETLEFFEQEITYTAGNSFLITTSGRRIAIKKIVEWEVVE